MPITYYPTFKNSSGNVGIGNINPGFRLDIKALTTNGSTVFVIRNANDANNTVFYDNGTVSAGSDFRAPIFYDTNNTAFYIDAAGTSVLSALTVGGNNVLTTASTLTAGNLSGTIPSGVLGNSTLNIGTTAIALNRGSSSQTLTGVSIDGNAATVTNGVYTTGNQSIAGNKTFTGITAFSNASDYQISLNGGGTTWAGIEWVDSNGTDYLWYNGQNKTFAIGGTGSNVSGKKLHVDGGITVGADYDSTTVLANGLNVQGPIQTGDYITIPINSLSASTTQARTFEIARIGIDFNDWNAVGTFEVELHEQYYSRGLKKVYNIWYGLVSNSGIRLVEWRGSGDNNFQCRIGTQVLVTGDQYYLPVFVDVRNYAIVDVVIKTNRTITTNTNPPIGSTYINTSPTATNITDFTADSDLEISTLGAGKLGSNIILTSANYSGYSTFSGSVTSTYGNFTTPGLIMGDAQYGFYVVSGNVYYKSASGGVHYWRNIANNANTMSLDNSGTLNLAADVRAPIFYDSNNTAYYIDAASGSSLNTLTMAGTITGALDAAVSFTGGVCTAASYNYILNGANDTGNKLVIFVNGSTRTADGGVNALTIRNDGGAFILGQASYLTSILGSSVTINSNVALHAGNYNSYAPTLTGTGASGSWGISVTGNAGTATILQTARNINGTSFNGSAAITTATWGTARTITIGSTGKSVDGSANVSWSLAELGAAATNQTMFIGTTSVAINRSSASQTLTGVSIDGNSATTTLATKATRANGNFYIDDNYGNTVVGLYSASRYQGVFAMGDAYKLAADGTTTGSLYGIAWSHPNAGGAAGNLSTHGALILENGSYIAAISSSIRCTADMRTPIYYDSNNTAFYADPASTSVLNRLTIDGGNYAFDYFQSLSDFTSGTLVTTDIPATAAEGESFVMNVVGKSYSGSTSPFNFSVQGYLYSSTIINFSGLSLDSTALSTIKIFENGGVLCFWWPTITYWNAFEVSVRAYNSAKNNYNRVTNITNSVEPTGTKKVTVTLQRFMRADVSATNSVDLRAPIFYDSNDTTYYTDPSSLSNILELKTNRNWYDSSASAWGGGINMGGNNPSIGFQSTASTWWYMLHHSSSNINFYRRSTSGSWNHDGIWDSSGNLIWQGSSVRGQVFYDNNNTAYYCDPATTSNFNDLYLDGDLRMNGSDSYIWMPNNNTLSTGFFDPVTSLVSLQLHGPSDGIYIGNSAWISYNTANNNSYNENIRLFAASNGVSTIAFRASGASGEPTNSILGFSDRFEIRQAGQWQLRSYANYIEAYGSSRAPIFYDSNNTAYYTDPASTSVLNRIDLPSGSATINTTTPGQTVYQLNFTGQSTNDNAQAITWGWSTSGAQAGIYVQSSGGYGTKMYIATTDSFATGSKTALTIDHTGVITTNRNYLQATGSLRAPIFYDSDNTGYYLDPASTSNLNAVTAAGNITAAQYYTGGWFRNNSSGNGLYNESSGQHFYSDDVSYWNVASSSTVQGIRLRTGGYNGTIRGYFYADNANDVGLLNNAGNWRIRIVGGDYTLFDGSSIRAQIFYDSNNTAYYIDAASTSVLNGLNVVDANLELYKSQTVDMSNTTTYSTSNYYPVTISVPTEGCIIQIQNNLNSNVPSWATHGSGFTLNLKWRTNGSGWGTTAVRRIIDQYFEQFTNQTICGGITQMTNSSTEVVWLRGGGQYLFKFSRNLSATAQSTTYTVNSQSVTPTSTVQNNIWNSWSGGWTLWNNITISDTQMQSPIYYDYNNTAYYVDAASTSNLVGLTVVNTITGSVSGNAGTATTLQTARNINGTSFNGSAAITTATWGTARTITIGSTGKSVDGSANVSWSLAELGAAATNQTMFIGTTSVAINRASASQTLTGISIDGSAASCTGNAATVTNGVYTTGDQTISGIKYFTSTVDPSTVPAGYAGGYILESTTGFGTYGIIFGSATGQHGAIGYSSNTMYFGTENGTDNTLNTKATLSSGGTFTANADVRSPIFYDSNNTGYYLQPNSTSNLLLVRTRNTFGERVAVSATASTTINTQYNVTELTLAATITTLTLSNIQASGIVHMWTIVTVGGGVGYSITWPAAVKWPGGTAPTLTTASSKRDIYQFVTYDGGTNIYAIIVGQNL